MSSPAFYGKPEITAQRQEFYERLSAKNTSPLWEVLARLVTPEPRSKAVPALWQYQEVRPLLMEAGRLITAEEAERRVLVLENPGLAGASQITQSLYAGMQLVLPGEVTPGHRHVASALRFVIEGSGAYTAVEGEPITMHPGDFILTPSWTFHDHGNPGKEPVVWLDGLDVPIVNLFDASFANHEADEAPRGGDESRPVFCYPYAQSRAALRRLSGGPVNPCHGVKIQYTNPANGGSPMPTIAAFLQWLPSGFAGHPYRSTDATVFCVVEGNGSSQVGEQRFEWHPHDIFVVPSWRPVAHHAESEAVLFSFSDRAAQKALGLWREEILT